MKAAKGFSAFKVALGKGPVKWLVLIHILMAQFKTAVTPLQTSHLSVYIRRNPYFNHFLRGISVFGYYPYFSVFCINCRLINRNPQLTLCSWTVPRTHAWAGTIVRPLPGELRPRGPIHVTPLGSIITSTATPLRNIESAQCRMRRHRIPV